MNDTGHEHHLTGDHFRQWWHECERVITDNLSRYPCMRFYTQVDSLNKEIEALQQDMQGKRDLNGRLILPTSAQKAEITAKIAAAQAQLEPAMERLRNCVKRGDTPDPNLQ
jgi:hypothetical protein